MFRVAVSKTVRSLASLPQGSPIKLVPTWKAFTVDSGAVNRTRVPFASVQYFFQNTLPAIGFNSEQEVTIMDVGCRSGLLTTRLIMPMFPNVTKVIAMDSFPGTIQIARAHNSHPKVEYGIANIEDWGSVAAWEGSISKLFSIQSFQWVQDEELAFENIHQLLHPGGEGAFYMVLQTLFYEAMLKISKNDKWEKYFENVDPFVALSHSEGHHATYYKELVEEMGFTVLHAEEKLRVESLRNDEEFRNFFGSTCVLVPYVPAERREEFKDDLFEYLLREGGRSREGLPIHVGNILEFVIRKD